MLYSNDNLFQQLRIDFLTKDIKGKALKLYDCHPTTPRNLNTFPESPIMELQLMDLGVSIEEPRKKVSVSGLARASKEYTNKDRSLLKWFTIGDNNHIFGGRTGNFLTGLSINQGLSFNIERISMANTLDNVYSFKMTFEFDDKRDLTDTWIFIPTRYEAGPVNPVDIPYDYNKTTHGDFIVPFDVEVLGEPMPRWIGSMFVSTTESITLNFSSSKQIDAIYMNGSKVSTEDMFDGDNGWYVLPQQVSINRYNYLSIKMKHDGTKYGLLCNVNDSNDKILLKTSDKWITGK